jgi:hypothetical protein
MGRRKGRRQAMTETGYSKLTVESAENGWIVKEPKQPTKIFIRWHQLVIYIHSRLATGPSPRR